MTNYVMENINNICKYIFTNRYVESNQQDEMVYAIKLHLTL